MWGLFLVCVPTFMKSPALQSMLTSDSSRLMTSLGSAMMKAAHASCGFDATKVKRPSVASMSKHPTNHTHSQFPISDQKYI